MSIKHAPTIKISQNDVIDHIVGMTEEQAVRTLKLNGENNIRILKEGCIFTQDFKQDRVNITIKNGQVIRATRG